PGPAPARGRRRAGRGRARGRQSFGRTRRCRRLSFVLRVRGGRASLDGRGAGAGPSPQAGRRESFRRALARDAGSARCESPHRPELPGGRSVCPDGLRPRDRPPRPRAVVPDTGRVALCRSLLLRAGAAFLRRRLPGVPPPKLALLHARALGKKGRVERLLRRGRPLSTRQPAPSVLSRRELRRPGFLFRERLSPVWNPISGPIASARFSPLWRDGFRGLGRKRSRPTRRPPSESLAGSGRRGGRAPPDPDRIRSHSGDRTGFSRFGTRGKP